jgi:uncharacterized protein YbjT (DUF2867 family)
MATDERGRTVFIAGATGYLGWFLTRKLCSEGWRVIAAAKDESERDACGRLEAMGASVVVRDAAKMASWKDILPSCGTVLSCMASRNAGADASNDFWAIDRDANARLGAESATAGVRHFLLFATFEGPDSRAVSALSEAKEAAVDTIRDCARVSGMLFTVVRANAYFKDLTMRFFDSVLRDGSFSVFEGGGTRINPIHGAGVADFVFEILCDQGKAGKEYPIGGPDIFTFREMGMLAAEVIKPEGGVHIKDGSLTPFRAMAFLTSLAAPFSRAARVRNALVRWMLYALTHDAVAPVRGHRHLLEDYQEQLAAAKATNGTASTRGQASTTC